jgi:hypothetical protein
MLKRSVFTCLFTAFVMVLAAACTPNTGQVDATVQPTVTAPTEVITTEAVATEPAATETALPPTEAAATTAPTTEAMTLDDFIDNLKSAIAARDFATLQLLMSDPFSVGYWLSEGVSYSPAEAAAFLESGLLPEGTQIIWAGDDVDLTSLLQGQPPEGFLGPDKQVVAALLGYGWGEDGGGEAIQFITQQPDGSYRWELMLYSSFGFAGLPTDVAAAVINADEATFYSGPDTTFEPVATVFGGTTYPVIGVSQDSQWWRLRCFDDNNALIPQCWVSADPAITSPTTLP